MDQSALSFYELLVNTDAKIYTGSMSHGKGWKPLTDEGTMKDYCQPLIALIAFLVKTIPSRHSLQLPITEDQHRMIADIDLALKEKKKDISLMHRLIFSLTAPPSDDSPIGRWKDPLICFIAASQLQVDGSFLPVKYATKEFAMWEYGIRGNALYHISKSTNSLLQMEK
jgi:hypothetical protein